MKLVIYVAITAVALIVSNSLIADSNSNYSLSTYEKQISDEIERINLGGGKYKKRRKLIKSYFYHEIRKILRELEGVSTLKREQTEKKIINLLSLRVSMLEDRVDTMEDLWEEMMLRIWKEPEDDDSGD